MLIILYLDLSNSFEESRISDMAACSPRSAQSPVSHEILKQQASVFDWISKNGPKEKVSQNILYLEFSFTSWHKVLPYFCAHKYCICIMRKCCKTKLGVLAHGS